MSGRLGRTAAVYFGSQVARTVAGFVATWVIASELGSGVLGAYSAVLAMLFFLNVPASAIARATNKRMSETGEHREFLGAGHLLNAACTVVLVAGIVVAGDQIEALANGQPVTVALAGLVVVQGLFDLVVGSLRGAKRVGGSGLLKTLEQVVRTVLQVAVVVVSAGFVWLVWGHAAALAIATVVGAVALGKRPQWPARSHVASLLEYAKYGWLGTTKTRAFAWADTFVLSSFAAGGLFLAGDVTFDEIGIYQAAWTLASALALLSVSISQTLFPEVSDLGARGDYDEVRHLVGEGLAFTGLFTIPGVVGAAIVGGDLLAVYGEEFARGRWILVGLVGAHLLSGYSGQYVGTINAVDRPDVAFRINALFLVANLGGNVALVALFGWYGAALATVLTAGVSLVAAAVALTRLVGRVPVPVRTVGAEVGAAAVMGAALLGLRQVVPAGPVPAVGLVAVGAGVYGFVLVAVSTRVRGKVRGLLPAEAL